jgi:hypothetical protein
MPVIDLKNMTVRIKDGATNSLDLKIGAGNITYEEHRPIEYVKDRGKLDSVRLGDEDPVDVRLDLQWDYITGTTAATPEDALKGRGQAASWVSSGADPCEPYAVDLVLVNNVPCTGANNDETIVLAEFRYETIGHDPKAGTLSVAGKCNVREATATRGTITS